jgi:hypothetical protein
LFAGQQLSFAMPFCSSAVHPATSIVRQDRAGGTLTASLAMNREEVRATFLAVVFSIALIAVNAFVLIGTGLG